MIDLAWLAADAIAANEFVFWGVPFAALAAAYAVEVRAVDRIRKRRGGA